MVDMEQQWIDDKSGQYHRELLGKLRGYEGDVARLIGVGVSSEKCEMYDNSKSHQGSMLCHREI
jgi:hypothetical protein